MRRISDGILFKIILIMPVLFIAYAASPFGASGAEQGGVTGAEFLNAPPTSRYNAMGGVMDGLGSDLEGIHYNPALLSTLPGLGLSLNINPYPNEVSHDQLTVGLPIFGGVGAASAQLFNTGGFTYINEDLQPEETVSVYDAAVSLGYSRFVWKSLSVGATAKVIHRTLGEYHANALGADIGGAYWFETPHFGKRPKPPTDRQLDKEIENSEKKLSDERHKRIKEATKEVEELKDRISGLEKERKDVSAKIAEAEDEKKAPLLEKQQKIDDALSSNRERLKEEEEKAQGTLGAIEEWYEKALQEVRDDHNEKLSDLKGVELERARLYDVIADPKRELTEDDINYSVDETIEKTVAFLEDRKRELGEVRTLYMERRKRRIKEMQNDSAAYREMIESEFGPELKRLNEELESLNAEKQSLEGRGDAVEKTELQEAQKRVSAKEKEIQALQNDPWLKRLESRIEVKEEQIEETGADITKMEEETEKSMGAVEQSVERDIETFNTLRTWLIRELKKAKLRRELDLLKSRNDKQKEKAVQDYRNKEESLYLRLLSMKFKHEEKILESKDYALKSDFDSRTYDIKTGLEKELERLEDDRAFKERFIYGQIAEIEKDLETAGPEGSEDGEGRIEALKAELEEMEETFKMETARLKGIAKKSLAEEQADYEVERSDLKWRMKTTRLVYLQSDIPYLNTSVHFSVQNFGTQVKFVEEGYPLPTTFNIGAGYAVLNTDLHAVKLGVQARLPVYNKATLGIGAEYGFLNTLFLRTGYTFGALNRKFSAGMGARVTMGFTEYSVDYTFQPIPDYGIVHSFGVSAYF